jgi:hypothetical protein
MRGCVPLYFAPCPYNRITIPSHSYRKKIYASSQRRPAANPANRDNSSSDGRPRLQGPRGRPQQQLSHGSHSQPRSCRRGARQRGRCCCPRCCGEEGLVRAHSQPGHALSDLRGVHRRSAAQGSGAGRGGRRKSGGEIQRGSAVGSGPWGLGTAGHTVGNRSMSWEDAMPAAIDGAGRGVGSRGGAAGIAIANPPCPRILLKLAHFISAPGPLTFTNPSQSIWHHRSRSST